MTELIPDAQAIINVTRDSAPPVEVEAGKIYVVRQAGANVKLDLTGEEYREFPERKRGTVSVRDVESFKYYYQRHSDEDSEVFADLDAAEITAVLDAHRGHVSDGEAGARWEAHRLLLAMRKTPQWEEWIAKNRSPMTQQAFAEFIEDHAADITPGGPCTASDLLEMAQEFHAHTKVTFGSAKRLKDGQTQLTYSEETTASGGGGRGTIEIPEAFELAIRPFDDSDAYRIKARFRYRLNGGDLRMFYQLDDPDRTFRHAVLEVVTKAAEACSVTIMRGRPA